ncbi:MAG TPA: autotransporter-associated beta strand repeat-containing protein, partial [Xanthobacteraceae bacterium]
MGGAIFVVAGGTLTIAGQGSTAASDSVTGGASGGGNSTAGSAFGKDIFINGANTITFSPGNSNTYTVVNDIADEAGNGGNAANKGAVAVTGGGTLVLSGTNTYAGGTTVTASTLNVSADANLGASTGGVTLNGGTLQLGATFNTSSSRTFTFNNVSGNTIDTNGFNSIIAGTVTGAGGFTKTGAGTLTLGGTVNYTGPTTINGGNLALAGSGIGSLGSVNVANAAGTFDISSATNGATITTLSGVANSAVALGTKSLTLSNASDTFAGVISGTTGGLTLTTGTETLTGTNTYGGATIINGGALVVNGAIVSATSVNTGGALAGVGVVGAVTVNNGGTFAPGPSGAPGSMSTTGPLTFQSGGTYKVQVTPTTASIANVGGAGTLTGGSVNAQFTAGTYVAKSYDILHTTGLGGTTFTGVTGNVPRGFLASLSYTTTDVMLNLTGALDTSGLSGNQQNVATTLNTFLNNGGTVPPGFVPIFGLSGPALATALTQLSGEAATGAQQANSQLMNAFLGILTDPFG